MQISRIVFQSLVTVTLMHSLLLADIVGFWPFYENTNDISGNGHNATSSNVTLTSDRFENEDYAYLFDGSESFIEIADAPSLDITGELTIETWVNVDRLTSLSRHTILTKPYYDTQTNPFAVYALTTNDSATAWEFRMGNYLYEFGSIEPGSWQHIAVTFNHVLQRANCYQNGELVSTNPAILDDLETSDQPLMIGANIEHTEVFHGIIDDIRLYNSALNQTEIDSLYNIPFGVNQITTPVSHIALSEVYIGYPETTYVEIRSYGLGLDSLEVSDVTFSHEMFSTDFVPITLGPSESTTFSVVCNPTINETYSEVLTIHSNDPLHNPQEISITGVTLVPPNIIVTPEAVDVTVYTGAELNYTLTVDNTMGGGVLGWTSKVVDGDSSTSVFFERPDWVDWTDPVNQGRITPHVWLTRDNTGGLFNAFWESAAEPPFTPHRIKWAWGGLPQSPQNFASAAIINHDPITFVGELLSVYCYDDDVFAEVTFETWSETGGGFSYTRSFLAPEWLNYETMDETEWTHGSYTEELILDASGMRGGQYSVNIRIDSNSPDANEVFVPINLTVIEAPDYEMEFVDFNFSQGFIGYPDTIEAEIFNRGYGDLVISGVSLPGVDLSVTPTNTTILEDTSQVFIFVFNPQSLGDQSGDVVISTNDPDELSIVLPTQAVGQEAPTIQTDVSEVELSIEEDDIVEHSIMISNPGQSELQVELYAINYIEESPANYYNFDQYEHGTFWGPTYFDPIEQNVLLDLKSLTVGLRGDEVLYKLEGYESLHYRTTEISIDTDMNQGTGFEKGPQFGWQLGTEYGIEVSGNRTEITDHDTWEFTNLGISTFDFENFSKVMVVGVAKTLFGPAKGWNSGVLGSWFWYPDALPSDGTPYIHVPHIADWVFLDQTDFTISPGDSSLVTVSISTNNLPLGSNQALLHLINNDPTQRDYFIPVTIDVLVGVDDQLELPTKFAFKQNYPNPFNPSTTFQYELPEAVDVTIQIFDILGRNIWDYEESAKPAGYYSMKWDGTDETGRQVAAGMYFAHLQAGEFSSVVKMVYLR